MATGDAKTPGSGKSNPFGGGQGTTPGAGKAKPFDPQTGTGSSAGGKAAPFDQFAQSNPQAGYNDVELAQVVTADGGRVLKADPGNQPSAVDVGTRTEGQAKSGFKLNG